MKQENGKRKLEVILFQRHGKIQDMDTGVMEYYSFIIVCVKRILTPPNFCHSYHYLDCKVHKAHKMIPPHNVIPRISYPPDLKQCFPPWHKTTLTVGVSGPKKVQNK